MLKETWYSKNKEKALAQAKAWKEANPERNRENINRWKRENRLRLSLCTKKYQWKRNGIALTHEEYDKMWNSQAGLCKICNRPSKSGRKLAVDHCHTTGKIRGLLCAGCNTTLGHIEAYKAYPDRWDNYLKGAESIPVTVTRPTFKMKAPGYDRYYHGDYAEWCLLKGIDPEQDWTPTESESR